MIGCSNQELSEREVAIHELDQDVKSFYDLIQEENGAFLYQDGEKGAYVIINYASKGQNEPENQVENFQVENEEKNLFINYEEREGDSKGVYVYKISYDQSYDTIHLKKNGEDIAFQCVSGRN